MTGLVTLSPRETDTNVAHNVVVKVNCGSGSSVTQLSANSKDAAEDLLLLDLISFFDIRYIAKINGGRSPLQRGKVNYSKLGPPKPHVGVRESVDKNKDSLKNRAKNTRTICVKETVKKDAEKGGVLKGRRSRALQTALGPLLKLIREKV